MSTRKQQQGLRLQDAHVPGVPGFAGFGYGTAAAAVTAPAFLSVPMPDSPVSSALDAQADALRSLRERLEGLAEKLAPVLSTGDDHALRGVAEGVEADCTSPVARRIRRHTCEVSACQCLVDELLERLDV